MQPSEGWEAEETTDYVGLLLSDGQEVYQEGELDGSRYVPGMDGIVVSPVLG